MQQILADSLASVWVALICFAYTRRSALLLPMLAVAVLVRVDLFIFVGLMLLLLLLTEKVQKWGPIILCGCFVVCVFLAVQQWADSYGWKTLYYFAILSEMSATHPSLYSEVNFSLAEYLHSLVYPPRWISKMYLITAVCTAITLTMWLRGSSVTDFHRRVCAISSVCVLYIIAHYLIFPQMYLRFFVAQNMVIFTGCMIMLTLYLRVPVTEKKAYPNVSVAHPPHELNDHRS